MSTTLEQRAHKFLPAGGFGNFDHSVILERGLGSRVWDHLGNEYVDYLIGSGPMLMGHAHPEVLSVVHKQLKNGTTFFANNPHGIALAEEICGAVACADQVRFVSSGGEADMYAMRLARAHTGRNKILKFEGGYHGMSSEALMSLAPKDLVDFPRAVPDSAGIPNSVREQMLIAPFNNEEYVLELLAAHGDDIAAIIVEPLQRLVPPKPGFLAFLREQATRHGVLLIFDEVVTGFRLSYGGAQEYYGVTPDLCTLGKIIGGGFPLAAITGKEDIMAHFDKQKAGDGFTFQIGTLSGNPIAAIAGLKTMELLRQPGIYDQLFTHGRRIMECLTTTLTQAEIPHQIVGEPVLFDVVFTEHDVVDYRSYLSADHDRAKRFNGLLREKGILKPDGKIYPSVTLTEEDLNQTFDAIDYATQGLLSP